ncbi:MAG: UDP-N-acetylmuramoyl-L-alanyl-D-glutamate--2,6-diaminopimelate ligase [Chloroflexota bacterium]
MRLQQLLDSIADTLKARPTDDVEITSPVAEDNRDVKPGGVFVARKGPQFDAHDLIGAAVTQGAVAVIGERSPDQVVCSVPYAQVMDAQQALGPLAAAYYGYPSRQLMVIGVTGTDGKTTTTNLIFNILKAAEFKIGMISTVSAVIGDKELPTGLHVTTPSAPDVQRYLREMVDAGLTHCLLETTSHGLAQGRVNGVDYDIAVITNITHEHLDFHGSFENYRAAKALLFKNVGSSFRKPGISKIAVVNLDDANAATFLAFPADYHITYGLTLVSESQPNLVAQAAYGAQGTTIAIGFQGDSQAMPVGFAAAETPFMVQTTMVGSFNVQNILAASAVALALNCSPEAIRGGLASMPPVPGRMERIDEGQNFLAIVDFAHTPNALRRALEAAHTIVGPDKRIICVFGSAGLRDREKRRLMAEIGAELADISILTAEDPRTESLDAILQTMADGAISKGGIEDQTFYCVPDRGAALAFACKLAHPGDLVIACGKGHEQSMAFGTLEYPWDDRDALRAALHGTPLRTLPTAQTL